jgi:hypothetical protein
MPHPPDRIPPHLPPGVPLSHTYPNSWSDLLRAMTMTLGKRLRLVGSGSHQILEADIAQCSPLWIRIASAYNPTHGGYAWTGVTRRGGAWVGNGTSGAADKDPAKEANGDVNAFVGQIVPARREGSGELIFQLETCP